ncbi:DoxX-like family protein [Polluticoccus soli]|uniref:DoxX-like family protein n=1 Tax=Polluticoccus soli TaxID=3034150 RepID=UPI0023E19789|nr:DoxX-like family protein [Flavipsychrobacter sp. JY13-12]
MKPHLAKILSFLIATVWLLNGLCKIFDIVPRHEMIVSRILGVQYAHVITIAIGFAEVGMTVWIISGIMRRLNVITQIVIIAAMNILEFVIAPDLLLWGRFNSVFALLFILLIYFHATLNKRLVSYSN